MILSPAFPKALALALARLDYSSIRTFLTVKFNGLWNYSLLAGNGVLLGMTDCWRDAPCSDAVLVFCSVAYAMRYGASGSDYTRGH